MNADEYHPIFKNAANRIDKLNFNKKT